MVEGLYVYPVKSCAGFAVDAFPVTKCGPLWDRHWLIVNASGDKLTQRSHPQLSQLKVEPINYLEGQFKLSYPDHMSIYITAGALSVSEIKPVKVWGESLQGVAGNVEADLWLSQILNETVFLVENNSIVTDRSVEKKYGEAYLGFADKFPFLLLGTESLSLLQSKVKFKVPVERFRPNILLKTTKAHEEDQFEEFRLGAIAFKGVKHCSRCKIIDVDPKTGLTQDPLLKVLMQYRRGPQGVLFGENLIHCNQGVLSVGDLKS